MNEIPMEEETWMGNLYRTFDSVKKSFLPIMRNWSDIIFYTGNVEVNIFFVTLMLMVLIACLRYFVGNISKRHEQIAAMEKKILKEDKGTVTDVQSFNRDASTQDQGDFSKASTINCSFCGNPVPSGPTPCSNYKLRPRVSTPVKTKNESSK